MVSLQAQMGAHLRKIQGEMASQTLALIKIATSTWYATFISSPRENSCDSPGHDVRINRVARLGRCMNACCARSTAPTGYIIRK